MINVNRLNGDNALVETDVAFATEQISVQFSQRGSQHPVIAVDRVSLSVKRGETLALVGESGSGKTTLGRVVSGLNRHFSGNLELLGNTIRPGQPFTGLLRRRVQVVFQDPSGSLDPRQNIVSAIAEPLLAFKMMPKADAMIRAAELLSTVGLDKEIAERLPHQISGGQRQRVAIARAIASEPDVLVLDEPVSALDVSVQAQIVNLLLDLQDALRITFLLISHDLSVVRNLSSHVAVMYRGAIVEHGTPESVLNDARHPYTQALVSAIPGWNRQKERIVLRDGLQGLLDHRSSSCRFVDRCWLAQKESDVLCNQSAPDLLPVSDDADRHTAACHFRKSSQSALNQHIDLARDV